MHRVTRQERQEFVGLICKHTEGSWELYRRKLRFAESLLRYGARLGRIAENYCNGYDSTGRGEWDEAWAKREEREEERIQKKVTEICAEFGCTPVFQNDPRGYTLAIQVPGGYSNTWAGSGIGVPTS